ncbi:hypothetical protein CXB51_003851 [Gossypium anomalum]|uniref:Pyrrolo-quinoline quinone repeat domain-containing protein n=1 Tax=Gossypium anomalum TaxID=47600 RepID=A0A8J5Z6B9_9ROSI|nr:hypothetical protein CXB51_003851 [Gossypium anomalum]
MEPFIFASWNGNIYAIKACDGATPTIADDLLIIGISGPAIVIAVERLTGELVWSTQVDNHPAGIITMSGTYYKGHIFSKSGVSIEQCCTFRGSFAKLDVRSGKVLWQTFTLTDNFGQTGGYAGAAVWGSSPSIDATRNHVYVGTGTCIQPLSSTPCQEAENNQTVPTSPGKCVEPENHSDSILAFDLETACNNLSTPNCPPGPNPDADFGEAPMMLSIDVNGTKRDIAVAVQKSGFAWALNRDNGDLIWSTEVGPGGPGGGGTWARLRIRRGSTPTQPTHYS